MFTINIYIYNQPSEDFAEEDLELVVVLCVHGALNMPNSGVALNEHGFRGMSKVKLPWSFVESFSSDSRVGA
jgi:hypothetical protein